MECRAFLPQFAMIFRSFIAINFLFWLKNVFYHFITPYGRHHCRRCCENTSLLVNIAGMYGTNVIVHTFLTIAYISKLTRNCHNKNQRGWDLVMYVYYCNTSTYILQVLLLLILCNTTMYCVVLVLVLNTTRMYQYYYVLVLSLSIKQ